VPSPDGNDFGKRWRIRRRKEYLAVQGRGVRIHATFFLLLVLPNRLDHPRLGITVSRKVGNAVVRNRVRRHVREVFRQNKAWFPMGLDVVVIAKRRAANVSHVDVYSDLERCRGRLRREAGQPLRRPGPGSPSARSSS